MLKAKFIIRKERRGGGTSARSLHRSNWGSTESHPTKNMLKHLTMNDLQYNRGFGSAKPVKVCQSDRAAFPSTSRRRSGAALGLAAWRHTACRWSLSCRAQLAGEFGIIQHYSGLLGEPGLGALFRPGNRPGERDRPGCGAGRLAPLFQTRMCPAGRRTRCARRTRSPRFGVIPTDQKNEPAIQEIEDQLVGLNPT